MMYRMNLTNSSSHLSCRKVGIYWTNWNKTFYRHSCSPTDIGWLDIKLDIHGSQMMYRITQIYWLKVIYFTFNYSWEYIGICLLDWHKIVYRYSCSQEDKFHCDDPLTFPPVPQWDFFFFFRKIYWELLDILAWQICDWHSRSSEVEHIKVLTTLWRLDTNTSPGGPWMTLGISFKIFLCGLTDQVLDFLNDHRGFTPISCMTVKCGEIRTRYYIRYTLTLSNLS